jgi:hypothetical protein
MAFTAVTKDIIVEEGTFTFNYVASGTVLAGQALCIASGSTKVKKTNVDTSAGAGSVAFLGVAVYSAKDNELVAVAGPGNKVRSRVVGACGAGTDLGVDNAGYFKAITTYNSGNKVAVTLQKFSAKGDGDIFLI